MPDTLLSTKLYIPRPRRELVPRPRLIARLDAGLLGKLTLVSAPAGYGKTTLVSDWIARSQLSVAWLSLDAADNDPTRFLTYLIAALQQIDTRFGADIRAALEETQAPAGESLLTRLVSEIEALVDDLAAGSGQGFVLVLDDYHLITAPPIHDALVFLLGHLPPAMHFVISGRADPPLPISRLRVRGQVTEIRTAELRFTKEEAAAFLNDRMGLDLSPFDIAALEARTEGWIASLQLAALSMRGRQDKHAFVAAFSGSHRYVIDYLVDEVVSRQPETLQTFLRQTSILDRFSAPLCDAVCSSEGTASRAILRQLEDSNLFLIPLDDERRWYRYHHLFADFLGQRLREQEPSSIPELHRRASQWHEAEGAMDDAIEHALAAGDLDRAAHLVDRIAVSLIVRRNPGALLKWVDRLPLDLCQNFPMLCVWHAWALVLSGQLDAVERWVQIAETHRDRAFPLPIPGYATTIRAYLANMRGDLSEAIALSHQALEQMEDAPPVQNTLIHQGAAVLWLGINVRHLGDLDRARTLLAQAVSLNRQAGNIYAALASEEQLGELAMIQGQLHQTVEHCRRGLQMVQEWSDQDEKGRGAVLAVSELHLGLGTVLYQWNDLAGAALHLQRAVELDELGGVWGKVHSYRMLAYLRQAEGETEAAVDLLHKACTIQDKLSVRQMNTATEPGLAQLRILLSRTQPELAHLLSDVAQRIEEPGLRPDDDVAFASESEYADLARSLIALDRAREALPLLERLLRAAQSMGRQDDEIRTLTQQALAFHALGELPSALASLSQALILAEPEGYVRLFLDEGEPMAALLGQAAARGVASGYVERLLALFPDAQGTSDSPQEIKSADLVETLSARELEVLRLMAAGLRYKEVAEQLVISLNTVRYHTRNIYGKLGVNHRTQAIARARELDLL